MVIEEGFDEFSELDQILQFSAPKVVRLVNILRGIRPRHFVDPRNRNRKFVHSEDSKESSPPSIVTDIAEFHESNKLPVVIETLYQGFPLDTIIPEAKIKEVTDDDIEWLTKDGWFDKKKIPEDDMNSKDSYESCRERIEELNIQDIEYSGTPDIFSSCAGSPAKFAVNSVCNEYKHVPETSTLAVVNENISNRSKSPGLVNGINDSDENITDINVSCDKLNNTRFDNCITSIVPSENSLPLTVPMDCDTDNKVDVDDVVSSEHNSITNTSSLKMDSSETPSDSKTCEGGLPIDPMIVTGMDLPSMLANSDVNANSSGTAAFNNHKTGSRYGRRRHGEAREKVKIHNPEDPDSVCGIVFVRESYTAKLLYRLLKVGV